MFEGTSMQFWNSLKRLRDLPDDTVGKKGQKTKDKRLQGQYMSVEGHCVTYSLSHSLIYVYFIFITLTGSILCS